MKPKPLIIITTYNRRRETEQTLMSLEATTDPDDVHLVVVDNGSTDGTQTYLARWYAKKIAAGRSSAELHLLSENIGCPHALNFAMELYREPGQPVVKIDNDVEILTPGWIGLFEEFSREAPWVAMIGPWYEELRDSENLKGKILATIEHYIVWPMIGHMVYHAGWFLDEVGFFDVLSEDHLYGFEDLLMCQKAAALGYTMVVLPSVKIKNLQRKNALDTTGPESRDEHVARLRPEYERRMKMIREGRYIFTDERGQPQID